MIMKDEKLVVLREWNSVTEAEMAKSILDGAGIFSCSTAQGSGR